LAGVALPVVQVRVQVLAQVLVQGLALALVQQPPH